MNLALWKFMFMKNSNVICIHITKLLSRLSPYVLNGCLLNFHLILNLLQKEVKIHQNKLIIYSEIFFFNLAQL